MAYNNRGAAYAVLGQYQLAIEDYDKAIQLDPDYDKAIQLDPDYPNALTSTVVPFMST